MLHIYGLLKDVTGPMERYTIATSTEDFSDFSEEDRQRLIDEITNISQTWQSIIIYMTMYLCYPLGVLNKYVYCKLTERPFLWLSHYSADYLLIVLLGFILHYHFDWVN